MTDDPTRFLIRKGLNTATTAFDELPLDVQTYLRKLHAFAKPLGAAAPVGSVVRAYPETAVHMVFSPIETTALSSAKHRP